MENEHKDFVNSMLKKSMEKEEAKPNSFDNIDMKKIEKIVKEEIVG